MPKESRVERLRLALLEGESFTRIEACERFSISGSTFQWVIKSLRDSGATVEYEELPGRRGTTQRRWSLIQS